MKIEIGIQNNIFPAVAVAVRRIKAGMEVHDSYGAVWYHMDCTERQKFLKVHIWLLFFQVMKISC